MADSRALGWLEGIIDGEASLCLHKARRLGGRGFDWCPVLTITSTSRLITGRVYDIVGAGSITGPYPNGLGNKPFYNYTLHSNGLRRLLPLLRFIFKETHRQLLLTALSILNGKTRWSTDIIARDEQLECIYIQLRQLNKRGSIDAVVEQFNVMPDESKRLLGRP